MGDDRDGARRSTGRLGLGFLCLWLTACPEGALEQSKFGEQTAASRACAVDAPAPSIDSVDLLFVVDNSESMREEQQALSKELPRLVHILLSGDSDEDGMPDFTPMQSLHLGIVSSDLGLPDVPNATVLGCSATGDDGLLLHSARTFMVQCARGYPTFLQFTTADDDPQQTASDFACIANLGTSGCGFEQPLEAALKALWPSLDGEGLPHAAPPNGDFVTDALHGEEQARGHGDTENRGFLRSRATTLLAIVLVTDEDDCSSSNVHHFKRSVDLPPDDPLANDNELNLRCLRNKSELFPIERYVEGFKALRPGNDAPVLFAGIVGVPPDLVSNDPLSDRTQSDALYTRMLDDPRMNEAVDPDSTQYAGRANLTPSCQSSAGMAYPPRRIVSLAKAFGPNSVIHSICNEELAPAMDALVERIAHPVAPSCAR